MKIRMKFTKQGNTKFVGHLDTVRLFQRALKIAKVPIAYSQGFNPHSLVYFAMPLAVGMSSTGEYMDIVTAEDINIDALREQLTNILPNGIEIIGVKLIEGQKESLMSLVDAATYEIDMPIALGESLDSTIQDALQLPALLIEKKTKKGLKEVDIKPLIRHIEITKAKDIYRLSLLVNAGSTLNLSPDLLLKAITNQSVTDLEYNLKRVDLLKEVEGAYQSIWDYEGAHA